MRWLLLLLILPSVYGLDLSEIMFDDIGNDDTLEYIELIGNESLENCYVSDSKASDFLELIQKGNEVILIVEEDSPYLNLTEPTIYSAGKAIGNGLGNSEDNITVTCEDILVRTWYARPESFEAGKSLEWNGSWIVANKTPGRILDLEGTTKEIANVRPGRHKICNDTLLLVVDRIVKVNQTFKFSVITDWYASWDVYADGKIISYGDTYDSENFEIITPNAKELKIVSQSDACGARQRAVRIVSIDLPKVEKTKVVQEVVEAPTPFVENQTKEPEKNKTIAPVVTAEVVYESEPNLVPWLSSFGIVVVVASGWAFFHANKDEKSI